MDQFLKACGATGPLKLTVESGGSSRRKFAQPFVLIGRDRRSDLVIDDRQVSRRHAFLQVVDGRLYYADLNSRTGTVRSGPDGPAGWLGRGHTLRIGPCGVRPRGGVELLEAAPPAGGPEVVIDVADGSAPPRRQTLNPGLTMIGRFPGCGLSLGHDDVSGYHCALILTADGLWAVDLISRGGIRVNGLNVRCARLGDGDVLGVGPFELRPRYAGPEPRADHPSTLLLTWSDWPASGIVVAATPSVPATSNHSGLVVFPSPSPWVEMLPAAMPPTDPNLTAVIQQFGLMQNQMFERFQDMAMMMFQAFAAAQRDQSAQVREDLARIEGLTREIQQLRIAPPTPTPQAQPAAGSGPLARPTGPPIDDQAHRRLQERLMSLQAERQGRWQRILAALTGQPPGDFTL